MKKPLLSLLLLLATAAALAQEGWPDRKGKLFLVPELWLSFGSTTYIEVAPMVGYHLLDRLAVGAGPHYIYQKQKATSLYPYSYETHVFGIKGFARFALLTNAEEFLPINLFSDLFVHAEYEGMSLEKDIYLNPGEKGRFIYHSFLVGGGITQRLGPFNSLSLMILWDVNESISSPYNNPLFRVGFNTYF